MTLAPPLKIVYIDDVMVAVDKPAGMLVHRSSVDKHETMFVLQHLRGQLGQRVYPVHRLDKPTSGVLVFAFSSEVASTLAAQFAARQVHKCYWLVCRGHPPATGSIDHALSPKDDFASFKRRRGIAALNKPAQDAVTDFKRLATATLETRVDKYPQTRYSLVEAMPRTGRKHQLRRHFKHISHPIIGDPKYGKSLHNRYFSENFQSQRLLLHAQSLTLVHPTKQQLLTLTASVSGVFADVVEVLFGADVSVPRKLVGLTDSAISINV